MTRAEKEEMIKQIQGRLDALKTAASVGIVTETAKATVKAFEIDGEQIPYEAPKPPRQAVREISSAWKEIAKNRD